MSIAGLHTALSGIRAARVGMDTTSHNVANANTDGYTRQRTELATTHPSQTAVGKIGSGVEVADIVRVRDAFLDQRVRSDLAAGGELDVRADLLSRTEGVFGEPDNGLTGELNEIWAAFEELSLRPDDQATRRQVVSALASFEARVKSVAGGLDTLQDDTTQRLHQSIDEVNGLLQRVAGLNESILDAQTGPGAPNDLLDVRDRLLDQLHTKVGARVAIAEDGTARVSIAGMAVVSGTTAQELAVHDDSDPAHAGGRSFDVMHPSGNPVDVGGEVAGMQAFLQDDLPDTVEQLDGLLVEVSEQLDGQHRLGVWFEDDGSARNGEAVFGYAGGEVTATAIQAAFNLQLTDPRQVAAATNTGSAGAPDGARLDGTNAARLAELRTRAPATADPVLDDELRELVTDLAARVQSAERRASAQQDLTAASQSAREGMHGVSIDEEMVNMLSHQRALEASSRVMTAVDQALDVLINRTGVVGR